LDVIELVDEISRRYDIDHITVLSLLKETIREYLNLGEIIDEYKNGKYVLYEYFIDRKTGRPKKRKVHLTKKTFNAVKNLFYEKLMESFVKNKIKEIKKMLPKDKVVKGIVTDIHKTKGLTVKLPFFNKAFAPKHLLNPFEEENYTIGEEYYFHINKIKRKKNRIIILLDRVSKNIPIRIIKDIASYVKIFDIKHKFGYQLKVYVDKIPDENDIKLIQLSFNEKVIFKEI